MRSRADWGHEFVVVTSIIMIGKADAASSL